MWRLENEIITFSPVNKSQFVLFSILLLLFMEAKSQNDQFTLKGKIIGKQKGSVYLKYINKEGRMVTDSCLIENGLFFFAGKINEPTLTQLIFDKKVTNDDDPNFTSFYLEPGNITAVAEKDDLQKIKITGSETQKENEILKKHINAINNKSDSIYEKISRISDDFIITHPNSYVSAYLLALYETRWSMDTIRILFKKLKPVIQKSYYGKEVAKTIDEIDNNSPGKMAKQFTGIDYNGASISLSNFKGRYILLDFWASWCAPCRQSFPHLKELFKKYHKKDFDIIGISDDYDTIAWKKAVEKDEVAIWPNILSGLKKDDTGETNESQWISRKFGVLVLPTTILIDKGGVIIGRYTGTEEEPALHEKLSEIFK